MKSQTIKTGVYLTPSCTVAEISMEGVLCSSGEQAVNTISDYVEDVYQW